MKQQDKSLKVKKVTKTELISSKGKKHLKFTAEEVISALRNSGGFVSIAAKKLNASQKLMYDYINRYPQIKEAKEEIENSYLDLTESELLKKIKEGEEKSIMFYLKTKGKIRGYVERTETEFVGDSVIKVVVK